MLLTCPASSPQSDLTDEFYRQPPRTDKARTLRYFIPSYTPRAFRNLFITNSFSAAEFQSG